MQQERKLAICYVFVYVFCLQIITTNTRTSTLWKLNSEQGKIVSVPAGGSLKDDSVSSFPMDEHGDQADADEDDESTFTIITATAANYRYNTWNRGEGTTEELQRRVAEASSSEQTVSPLRTSTSKNLTAAGNGSPLAAAGRTYSATHPTEDSEQTNSIEPLTCGKPVNFTHYDDLVGVAQRYEHNPAPEPEVAYLFLKRKSGQSLEHFNIDALERRLRRAKKEQPQTIQLWNQIGNFWRIKGNAGHAIECFRRALSVSPTNPDTLLNLARILFNLQYLDDAISLTKRSLEVHPPERSAWRQYFTLGEIFKAYGQLSDAILHLKQALALHPHYEPIRRLIAETEKIEFASNTTAMQFYTGLIIAILSFVVLMMVTVMLKTRHSSYGFGTSAMSITNLSSSSSGSNGYLDGDYPNDSSDSNNNNNSNGIHHNAGAGRLGPIINSFSLANFRPAKHFNRAQAMRSLRSVAFRSFRPFRYRK